MDQSKVAMMKERICEMRGEYLGWLFSLLRIRSVSADGSGLDECADAVAGLMRGVGLEAEIIGGYRAPVVYARHDEGAGTTLLIYGHYDVQPPGPLDRWESDPFEPVVRDGAIYARGVADNKGQFLAHIAAFGLLRDMSVENAKTAPIGCNLRFLIEGGEEVGSPDLGRVFEDHREKFAADAAFSADALQHACGRPFILPGLKGGITIELAATGANTECHGAMADIVPNPLWRIVHALNCIKDNDTDIRVGGFYDDAAPLSDLDLKLLSEAPNPIEELKAELGLQKLLPKAEENFHVSRTMPTCNISLMSDGNETGMPRFSLPTDARAVIRMNLVPNQEPYDIAEKVRVHLDKNGFSDVRTKVLSATPPSMTDTRHPYVRYAADIAREAFEREPLIYPRVIGSGPDYHFTRTLGIPSVWVPYAGANSETHAPNENMAIKDFLDGICNSALFFAHASDWSK